MPNTLSSTATTMTATRRCRQKATNWSIIEQDSALHDYLIAGLDAAADGDRRPFLQLRVDRATLEGPGRDSDEHAGPIVIHQQRGAGQHNSGLCRTKQRHGGKHVGFKPVVGVRKSNPDQTRIV